jgi:sugar lactone lactonase YvrE
MPSSKHLCRSVIVVAVVVAVSFTVASVAHGKSAATTTAATWGSFGPVTFGDMAFSPAGGLFVSDCGNARIYQVSQTGHVSVFAGAGPGGFVNGFSGDGGPALDAHFGCPYGLAFDSQGDLYVADHLNNRIRKIDRSGIVTTVVGGGRWTPGNGFVSSDEGRIATRASLNAPVGVSFDAAGRMYIGDRNHDAVRMVDTNGIITTIAGTGKAGYSGDGGAATAAQLDWPLEVAPRNGNLYLVDEENARVRRVSADGVITTFAGTGEPGCSGDGGPASLASVQNPNSLAFGPDGGLYITEGECHEVRRIAPDGTIQRVVGSGQEGCSGFNGPALDVQLSDPEELRFGPDGDLFVADQTCAVILRVDDNGRSHLYATAP